MAPRAERIGAPHDTRAVFRPDVPRIVFEFGFGRVRFRRPYQPQLRHYHYRVWTKRLAFWLEFLQIPPYPAAHGPALTWRSAYYGAATSAASDILLSFLLLFTALTAYR